jgi:hypothetical protein
VVLTLTLTGFSSGLVDSISAGLLFGRLTTAVTTVLPTIIGLPLPWRPVGWYRSDNCIPRSCARCIACFDTIILFGSAGTKPALHASQSMYGLRGICKVSYLL